MSRGKLPHGEASLSGLNKSFDHFDKKKASQTKSASKWDMGNGVQLRSSSSEDRLFPKLEPETHKSTIKEKFSKERPSSVESILKGRLSPLFPIMVVDPDDKASLLKDTRKLLKSHAIELETKLRECCALNADSCEPNPAVINQCTDILSEIALGPGPYHHVLMEVQKILCRGIFVNADSRKSNSLTFFQLCEQLRSQIRKLEAQNEDQSQKIRTLEEEMKAREKVVVNHDDELTFDSAQNQSDSAEAEDTADSAYQPRLPDVSDDSAVVDGQDGQEATRAARQMRVPFKRSDFEMRAMVVTLQQDLENNVHHRKEAEKVATDLKGAFLRLKRDYIELQDKYQAAEHQVKTLFIKLQNMLPLEDYEKEVENELMFENMTSFNSFNHPELLTPRPNWFGVPTEVKIACNLVPGKDRTTVALKKLVLGFRKLQKQKPSDAEEEIMEQEVVSPVDQMVLLKKTAKIIPCLGTGSDVPIYLRFHGYVRNRHMSKRDAERTVREIWTQKMLADKENEGAKQSMADFFYAYARKKFGAFPNMIAEWSYNLISVLERNVVDNDCDLFLKVLRGFLSEDVYYAQLDQISECERIALECDKMIHSGSVMGKANKTQFLTQLQQRFSKSKAEIAELRKALDNVYGKNAELFNYSSLFAEDREMNQNEFGETFRDQLIKEREEQNALITKVVEEVRDADDKVLTRELREAFHILGLTEPVIESYLQRGCGHRAGQQPSPLPERIEADQFLVNCGIECKAFLRY